MKAIIRPYARTSLSLNIPWPFFSKLDGQMRIWKMTTNIDRFATDMRTIAVYPFHWKMKICASHECVCFNICNFFHFKSRKRGNTFTPLFYIKFIIVKKNDYVTRMLFKRRRTHTDTRLKVVRTIFKIQTARNGMNEREKKAMKKKCSV